MVERQPITLEEARERLVNARVNRDAWHALAEQAAEAAECAKADMIRAQTECGRTERHAANLHDCRSIALAQLDAAEKDEKQAREEPDG